MTSTSEFSVAPTGKLLLVDDEPNILTALRRLLRQDGYRIDSETDPNAAIERLQSEDYDLIISDQRMPQMTGLDFLRLAKELRPHSIRIVLSGYTDLNSVTSAINEGSIYKFLTKPWDAAQLRGHIAAAIRHKNLEDENRRISEQLRTVNAQLTEANAQLAALVSKQQLSLFRDETALQTLQEVLRQIPLPIFGCDHQGMVVLSNEAAESFLGPEGNPICPLGIDIQSLWPELSEPERPWKGHNIAIAGKRARIECRPIELNAQARGWLYMIFPEHSQ
ncbi:response regulator [Acidovorax delafieldii]|uniref:response regulator n=1 Tax=Acidovorax delafieldii TaxID=47920 RepID=UPI003ED14695